MRQLSERVFVETGFSGCNVGFVNTSEGIVLIDTPGLPSDAVRWRETVEAKGKIKYVINTECHHDHVFGNFFFPDATVVGHAGMKQRFPTTEEDWRSATDRAAREAPGGMKLIERYVSHPPTMTYVGELDLTVGDVTLKLINLPGHSPEQTAVLLAGENIVFTGDNVVTLNNLWLHEADPWSFLDSLKRIAALEAEIIVPGHGEVCDKRRLPEMAMLINEWVEAVREAVGRGVSREEAIETISFFDCYPVEPTQLRLMSMDQRWNVANIWDRLMAREGQ